MQLARLRLAEPDNVFGDRPEEPVFWAWAILTPIYQRLRRARRLLSLRTVQGGRVQMAGTLGGPKSKGRLETDWFGIGRLLVRWPRVQKASCACARVGAWFPRLRLVGRLCPKVGP